MAFEGSRRFELVSKLGEGGMGIVYEAFDRERDMRVALKTLRKLDASSLYRFKREFRALTDLSHPNIIALYELVSEGDDWFLTMEMVGGGDFLDYVRRPMPRAAESPAPGPQRAEPFTGTDDDTVDTLVSFEPDDAAARDPMARAPAAKVSGSVDVDRLRDALVQLASALNALHQAGLVHRDLKPSNVRVTAQGRVVLMDFGIVAEIVRSGAVHDDARVVGTPSYMAPEQAAGDPPTAAADWYAFGVMLYVALTGRLPFRGPRDQIMLAKLEADPPPPSSFGAGVAPDLEALCLDLMARKPAKRPSGAEVLARLGGDEPTEAPTAATITGTSVFVGREAELDSLRDAYRAALGWSSVAVFVRGESGMGKTTLVRRFLAELGAITEVGQRPIVLRGRCHERESLSYKAFDGVVDALSHELLKVDPKKVAELLPDDVDLLTRLFPVLRRIPGVQVARPVGGGDPLQLRNRAIGVFRQLLANVAGWRPVVMWIDDLQWAGPDSLDLLDDITRRPAPRRLALIASMRTEHQQTDDIASSEKLGRLVAAIAGRIECREIELGPLSIDERRMLVARLLGSDSVALGDAFWAQSDGSPLLLGELARYLEDSPDGISGGHTPTIDEVLARRIDKLPDEARALLECIAVSGEPTPLWLLADAVDLSGEQRERASAVLRVSTMARVARPGHEPWMTAYHDRVRETVTNRMPEDRRRELHLRIAQALERWDHATVDALARHWLAAGDPGQATTYLVRAAETARDKLAFDRSAQLYTAALELTAGGPVRVALQRELGDVLVLAGRCFEAAGQFTAAAEVTSGDDALELHRRAADNLLRSGHVSEGLDRLSEVMDRLGAPFARTRRRALISLVFQRLRLKTRGLGYTPRTESEIAARDLARLDTLYAASTTLGMIDHIRGSAVQLRHLMTALRHGEERRVCRALAIEAAYLGVVGGRAAKRGEKLCRDVILQARRLNDPYLVGIAYIGMGTVYFFGGKMAAAAQAFRESVDTFTSQVVGAEWETITARYFYCLALINTGDFSDVSSIVRRAMHVAHRRNDVYAANLFGCEPNVFRMIFADRIDDAFEHLSAIEASWPSEPYYVAHYQLMLARTIAYLYKGDAAAAAAQIDEHMPALKSIMVTRMPMMMCELWAYRARAALLLGDTPGASRFADRIERTRVPMASGLAEVVRAAIAHAADDDATAQRRLTAAIDELAAAGVAHMKAACEYRLGALLPGDQGARLTESALAWMAGQGVVNPERMMDFLAPGF